MKNGNEEIAAGLSWLAGRSWLKTNLPVLLALAILGCASAPPETAGIVITNARVIDGSGKPSRNLKVRIRGERIADVGDFTVTAADTVVDARGLVLAPGFIDTHSHHEDGIFELPGALAAVSQGVTTIVAGQDGRHPYPLDEFFSRLEASPVAINIASYAGHGTLRNRVMEEDYRRQASPGEIAAIKELLRGEMEAGALGLSSGLEYDPGSFAETGELIQLARVVAEYGGNYASHIRSEDQYFWEAVEEAVRIGREAGIPARITHIKLAMTRWWGQADRLKRTLDEARSSGVDVTADIYPSQAWYAGFSWLATLFPERDLTRAEGADYILNDMLAPDRILIPIFAPDPAYNNLTVAEIAEKRGTDAATTLMELLQADAAMGGDASGSTVLAFAMNEPDIESIMSWPHTVVASDGDSQGAHPRGYGAFTRFLGHYVRERKVVSLEEGLRKITALPAMQIGIADRGRIEGGYYADLVLFDPDTVQDHASFEKPHRPSSGIARVWVNGQLVFDDDGVTGNRPGRPIRRAGR